MRRNWLTDRSSRNIGNAEQFGRWRPLWWKCLVYRIRIAMSIFKGWMAWPEPMWDRFRTSPDPFFRCGTSQIDDPGIAWMVVTNPFTGASKAVPHRLADDDRFRCSITASADDFDCISTKWRNLVVESRDSSHRAVLVDILRHWLDYNGLTCSRSRWGRSRLNGPRSCCRRNKGTGGSFRKHFCCDRRRYIDCCWHCGGWALAGRLSCGFGCRWCCCLRWNQFNQFDNACWRESDVTSCGRRSDRVVRRGWHAVFGENNRLFRVGCSFDLRIQTRRGCRWHFGCVGNVVFLLRWDDRFAADGWDDRLWVDTPITQVLIEAAI